MPPLCLPTAATDNPALQYEPTGLPRGRRPPHPLRGLNSHHHTQPTTAAAPPPRQPPQLLLASERHPPGLPWGAFHGGLSGPRMGHRHTGDTPLPLHSPPLSYSGGGWNVAARHILLALYVHHCHLHLSDLHLRDPCIAAPAPEARAGAAPEEVADYLRHTCRRFINAFGWQKGTPYPLSELLYQAHTRPSHPAEAPGGLCVLSGHKPNRPQRNLHCTNGGGRRGGGSGGGRRAGECCEGRRERTG